MWLQRHRHTAAAQTLLTRAHPPGAPPGKAVPRSHPAAESHQVRDESDQPSGFRHFGHVTSVGNDF